MGDPYHYHLYLLHYVEVAALLRHCLQCMRRFGVRFGGEMLPSEREEGYGPAACRAGPLSAGRLGVSRALEISDEEDWSYTYACTNCGHQRSEVGKKHPGFWSLVLVPGQWGPPLGL